MQIEERMGPALGSLQALLDEGRSNSFDFAFLGILMALDKLPAKNRQHTTELTAGPQFLLTFCQAS